MIASENFISSSLNLVTFHPYHFHENLVMLKVVKGDIRVKVLSNEYILKNDDVIVFNVGEIHSVEAVSDVNLVILFSFNIDFCRERIKDFDDLVFQCNSVLDSKHHKNKFDDLNYIIDNLIHEVNSGKSRDKVQSHTDELLDYLVQHFEYISMGHKLQRFETKIANRYKNLFKKVLKTDGEYSNYSLRDASEMFNVSYSHLRKDIKLRYGNSFRELKYRYMVENACRLILSSNTSITEIGLRSGFSDPKYLIKYTKEFYGLTPSQLRNFSNIKKTDSLNDSNNKNVDLMIEFNQF